ncbi:RimJ/RimL family protein N-acetyltransferase [Actinocorallia herbida]|uniref:RimJ/RimL family protein N-acetyltransferase n=1 Tax=Actinocorallia herbida TaxID=58109 RepID=A0A3N1CW16_9ACTN|nr:RimJ/RimL family protein N-acetyltransferase [Actinocorallia herbida]
MEIRAFEAGDVPGLLRWIDGFEALVLWTGPNRFRWPLDRAQLARYAAEAGTDLLIWSFVDHGAVVGHASLAVDRAAGTARLGRVLVAPEARGRGLGEAVVRAAQRAAFADPGTRRLTLGVYARNTGAVRLYERLGFVREEGAGTQVLVNGVPWSSFEMAVTADAWRSAGPDEHAADRSGIEKRR